MAKKQQRRKRTKRRTTRPVAPPRFDRAAHVYCDESGNSGPNLLDASQPVYVLGGWLVPRQYVQRAEQVVWKLSERLGLGAKEIHATKVVRTLKGQSAFTDFMRAMGRAGAMPVFSITEKRYWIAGKIVETYLDPFYNARVPWDFYNDAKTKQELANEISEMHDELLHEFAAAYRSQDAEGLARCALRLTTVFELKGELRLAAWFRASIPSLDRVAVDERAVNASLPSRALGTVNVPVLASFLSLLESLSRHYGMQPVRIYHDESQEFSRGYQWAFDLHKGAKSNVELRLSNGRTMVFAFECVESIVMVKSEECPLVQAADLLVSGLARYARHVVNHERPPGWLTETLDLTIAATYLPALVEMGTFAELMGSPRFLVDMNMGTLVTRRGDAKGTPATLRSPPSVATGPSAQ